MKTFFILTIAVMSAIGFAGFVPAGQAGEYNASQLCTLVDNLYPGWSHGDCVSIHIACREHGLSNPVCICKYMQGRDPDQFKEDFGNLGQCISALRK